MSQRYPNRRYPIDGSYLNVAYIESLVVITEVTAIAEMATMVYENSDRATLGRQTSYLM